MTCSRADIEALGAKYGSRKGRKVIRRFSRRHQSVYRDAVRCSKDVKDVLYFFNLIR